MFARHLLVSAALLLSPSGVAFAQDSVTQSPTAKCRDGSSSYSATRSGTCSGHGRRRRVVGAEQRHSEVQ